MTIEGCVECKKDIDNLYDITNSLDKKMAVNDANQKHYTETLEKVAESNEKLVDTLQNMQITFVKMDEKISGISEQVTGIDARMKKIEDDNNFQIMGFLKKNFPYIIIGLGMIAAIVSDMFKF